MKHFYNLNVSHVNFPNVRQCFPFLLSFLGKFITHFSPKHYITVKFLIDAHGADDEWYFTNAIAASSLQNSSNTITPSSNVMWSTL